MPTIDVRNSGIHGSVVRVIDLHMSQGESVVYIVLPSASQCPCSRRSRRGSWEMLTFVCLAWQTARVEESVRLALGGDFLFSTGTLDQIGGFDLHGGLQSPSGHGGCGPGRGAYHPRKPGLLRS